MIPWLLRQMEQHPRFVVAESALVTRWPAEFARWRRTRLLQRIPLPISILRDGRRLEVTRRYGRVVGLDTSDPEAEPLALVGGDLVQWRLDLAALAEVLREQNRLSGSAGPLDERVYLLGERETERQRVAIVLALLSDDATALLHLAAVPARLDHRFQRLVALCPSFLPRPTTRQTLRALGIALTLLGEEAGALADIATLVWPPSPVQAPAAVPLSEVEEEEARQRGFRVRTPLHLTGERAGREGVWVLCGTTRVRLSPAKLRLLLRLVVGLWQSPSGYLVKGKTRAGTGLIADRVCTEASLEQDISRLRETLGAGFAPLRGEDIVEVQTEQIRLSLPRRLVTWEREALTRHPNSAISTWAQRLEELAASRVPA